jgi:hypothetical protein
MVFWLDTIIKALYILQFIVFWADYTNPLPQEYRLPGILCSFGQWRYSGVRDLSHKSGARSPFCGLRDPETFQMVAERGFAQALPYMVRN